MRRRVHRWRGTLAGVFVLLALALGTGEPLLVAASVVPLTYVVYGSLSRVPPDAGLEATRTVSDAEPTPGEPVTVELTVTNTGPAALTDVRVIDRLPDELTVVEGSPRCCVSLRPGEQATTTYSVMAKRGTYSFEPPAARVRTLSGTDEVTVELATGGDTELVCANTVSAVPLADATLPRAGTLPTDSGGSGLEFHSTRNYQPGDPVNRIDWRRYAKTSELTTVDYREEQAVRTVLVVDARRPARVTPEAGYPTGAELAAYAAERLFDALSQTSVITSVAAVGLAGVDVTGGLDPDGLAWVDEADDHAAARAATVFNGVGAAATRDRANSEAGSATDRPTGASAATADGSLGRNVAALLARLPPTAQVVVFSPLTDDWAISLIDSLTVRNYPTTLVTPDIARRDTVGTDLFALDRTARIQRAELTGATVIDWDLDSPIDVSLRASLADLFSR